jgi:peptidoglycan/xylan/chitin deacetylase (PgdA/CDA1 family)
MPTPAQPGSPVTGAFAGVIRRVDRPDKVIALTFDLCQTHTPIAGYDGAIVDYLRAEQVAATFFCCGRWLGTHPTRGAQLLSEPRFVAANHSFGHPDLHSAAADRVRREILLTEAMLAEARDAAMRACIGGTAPGAMRLFRFPYGSCSPAGVAAANAAGSVVIQWDVVSGDPDGTSAATIQRNVLGAARPGSIVVMHANGRGTHTAEALRAIVPKLRSGGYRFVTVPELLAAGKPVVASECYIDHPGDTLRYDVIASHPAAKPVAAPARPHT